jgi:aminoglycoside 3-N-acetyltransferase
LINLSAVEPGRTMLLHSSLIRTMRVHRCRPEDVLSAFLERLGPQGTLLLPLFNFDFTKGVPFDIRHSPSQMGALTEIGRNWPGAVRTGHPIYSFAVIGKRADAFKEINNTSGYGADSPFAILRELDGEIAVLDLPDQQSMTFYHHVEEMEQIPYRYMKSFSGAYVDASGRAETRTYTLFVRDIESGVQTSVDRMGERLWAEGLYRGQRPKEGNGLRVIGARAMFDAVSTVIRQGDAEEFLFERNSQRSELRPPSRVVVASLTPDHAQRV